MGNTKKGNITKILVLMSFLMVLILFTGAVSAVSLNSNDIELASSGVKNYTEANSHVPSYVDVNGKNSSTASYLNTAAKFTTELNSGTTSAVTISTANAASSPSGSATGQLSKSEYVSIASHVTSFISTNGRAPNYASSTLGNIRYESLVYTYSKIIDFYATNGRLPNYVTVVYYSGTGSTGLSICSNLNICNNRTQKGFNTIQEAINSATTQNGDTIVLKTGTYTENIVINKKITLKSSDGANVILRAADSSNSVITVTSSGSGSTIENLIIEGSTALYGICLNGASNCTIYNNSFLNNTEGICLEDSENNTIQTNYINNSFANGVGLSNSLNNLITENTITNSSWTGIYLLSSNNNTIQKNTVNSNSDGMDIYNSLNNIITKNTITNNSNNGLTIYNSAVNIHFNIILGNTVYGLENDGTSTINATNNWWGTNTPTISSTNGSDIHSANGTTVTPWLILNTTASSTNSYENATITADLTHNNTGGDTSPQGHVPDNIPINFATNLGTITNTSYTRNGKASASFNRGTSTSQTATITTTLNNQTVNLNLSLNDTQLTVTANPLGNYYNTTQNITLNSNSTVYYTLDGSDPGLNGILYSNPISINNTTTIKYIATDNAGNWSPEYTQTYTIDSTAPTATASLEGGVYSTTQNITLTATDNLDSNPTIYYTLDGTNPTTSSTIYTGPITLQMNTTTSTTINLKFMAVDHAGNKGEIQSETYILTLPVINANNNNTYSIIQDAINDPTTIDGDTIRIYSGTYTETITVNKKLLILPVSGNTVTIKAADSTGSVFIITNSGSGSVIEGFTLKGNINLEANNCTIYLNTITGNGTAAIITSNSFNNTIMDNLISSTGFTGIQSNSSSNTIYGNTITGCETGIYSENSNDKLTSNNIINNHYGIWTYNSTDTIQFNRITGNTYGLKNNIGTVDASNNWWGSNSDPSTITGNILNENGTVTYTPWLVLSVTPSSTNSGGNASVTADLTHKNTGGDTSPQGHVPDGIPVNFTTTFGTITGTAYTVKGKATTILNLGSTQNATVTTSASLDNQTVNATGLITIGTVVVTITSTAIDSATGQPLNITYNIPLNESVTWFSVIGTHSTMGSTPVDDLKVIVDGTVVMERTLYPSSSAAVDTLTINLVYPGVNGYNITVTDPNSTAVTNLTFPGNNIQRTSKLTFMGSPFDFLQSFSIATTDVTTSVAQYWLNQQSNYTSSDAMKAAYNAFLASLMVEYIHDQIADNIASTYNVTWSRTSPIMVSFCEDRSTMYLTLDCDHSMGMTVIGTPANMWQFNYITSSSISLIEGVVMNASTNGTFSSITMDLINAYLSNSTSLKMFLQNGSLIEEYGNEFIVIDPETGICRDINTTTNLCGIADYIWGDIQLERWILQHWGETVTMLETDLTQFVNSLVTGKKHVNINKIEDMAFGVFIFGMGYEGAIEGAEGIVAGCAPEPLAPVVLLLGVGTLSLSLVTMADGVEQMESAAKEPWTT